MKKLIKKILAVCVSAAMAASMAAVSAGAEESISTVTDKEAIVQQLEADGFRIMTDKEVREMYARMAETFSLRSGVSLPYSSGVNFADGGSSNAYTPIFDVAGQMTNRTQVRLSFTVNSGKHRLATLAHIYIPEIGWAEQTKKEIVISPSNVIYTTTVSGSITQFYIEFIRDDSVYATDFDYTLKLYVPNT